MTSTRLLSIQQWLLILFWYALPLHEAIKNILWGLSCALWIYRCVTEKGWLGWDRGLSIPILLSIVSGWISTLFAIESFSSWKGLWDLVRGCLMFWMAASCVKDETFVRRTYFHLIIASLITSIASWENYVESIHRFTQRAEYIRVQVPSVGHYNQSAIFLGMLWFIIFPALISRDMNLPMKWKCFVLILLGAAIWGTTSRTILIVVGIGTLAVILHTHPAKWVYIALGSVFAGGTLATMLIPGIRERIFFHGSMGSRELIWNSAWGAFQSRPLTGVGLNNFKYIGLDTHTPFDFGTVDHAHSLYMNTLTQTGILGAISIVWLLIGSTWIAWRLIRRHHILGMTLFGLLLVVAVGGCSNTTLHHEMACLFFSILGISAASLNRQQTV